MKGQEIPRTLPIRSARFFASRICVQVLSVPTDVVVTTTHNNNLSSPGERAEVNIISSNWVTALLLLLLHLVPVRSLSAVHPHYRLYTIRNLIRFNFSHLRLGQNNRPSDRKKIGHFFRGSYSYYYYYYYLLYPHPVISFH